MAPIDTFISSPLYRGATRAFLGSSVLGISQSALNLSRNKPLERLANIVFATFTVAQMLRSLPIEPLMISAYADWAPTLFTVMGISFAYFAPHLNEHLLRTVQLTAVALTILSAYVAPSAVTLATLGAMALFALDGHEGIPSFFKVLTCALPIFALSNALYAIKQLVLSMTVGRALILTTLGLYMAYSLYTDWQVGQIAAKTSQIDTVKTVATTNESQNLSETLTLSDIHSFAENAYLENLPNAFAARLKDLTSKFEEDLGCDLSEDEKKYLDYELRWRWHLVCDPKFKDRISLFKTLSSPVEQPDWSKSPRTEWLFGCYTSFPPLYLKAAFNPFLQGYSPSLLNIFFLFGGQKYNLETLLCQMHCLAKEMASIQTLAKYSYYPPSHLNRFSQGVTQF